MRRLGFASALGLVVGVLAIVPATPALAALTVTVDVDDVLHVVGSGQGDHIGVRCNDAGNVEVSGDEPGTGSAACSTIAGIDIAAGGGGDDVSLVKVDPATFSALTSVVVAGGDGRDRIKGSPFDDQLLGGPGKDDISADPLAGDEVDGGDDHDSLSVDVPREVDVSDDTLTTPTKTATFTGIEGLAIDGTSRDDRIDAHDVTFYISIDGKPGDDRLIGGSGRNSLYGAAGDDTLIGGPHLDFLTGGHGDDVIRARGGNESVYDDKGHDRISLGRGRDTFAAWVVGARNVFRGGRGRDVLEFQELVGEVKVSDSKVATQLGSARLSSIELVRLSASDQPGKPVMFDARRYSHRLFEDGSPENDVLLGGSGKDSISGQWGNDHLSGGPGNDDLDGGDGIDTCDGGPGRDRITNCE